MTIKLPVGGRPVCTMLSGNHGGCALSQLLELINRNDDYEQIGGDMLRIVVEGLGADRGYVFQYSADYVTPPQLLFECFSENGSADSVRSTREPGAFSGYLDFLFDHRPVVFPSDDIAVPEEGGIGSRVVCGIWVNDRLYGFIGMDWFDCENVPDESTVKILHNAAIMFALAFKQTHQYEQLQESVSLSRQIMDNLPIPILLVDPDFRVRAANPSKKVNVDLPLPKLLGTFCYDTVCKCGAPPDFCAVQETIRTRKPARKEFSFGGKRLISTSQPIFDRRGKMKQILSVDIDITEVTNQKEELKAAMEQAQAANLAKSYFLATVSHELRTPLNAVIGFSEILQDAEVDDATRKEYLNAIHFAGTALLNLINDVLDLSSLEADKTVIAPSKNDVAGLLEQVGTVFKLKAKQKGISLTIDASGMRQSLYVDNLRLRQILLNLIGNAVKFTAAGGVSIKGVFTPGEGGRGILRVSVSDTGIGISPQDKERIFEPFVHDSVIRGKRMYEGSGLGLTISRRLAAKMGGSITLESELGKGSSFQLEIGTEYEEKPPTAGPEKPVSVQEGAGSLKKDLHLLLVDDVPINLKVLAAMLTRFGVRCTQEESPAKAIDLLRQGRRYDMILTDMWMPEMNGLEMTRHIRQELKITDIPILIITADTQVPEEFGKVFDYVLYKPVTMKSLAEMFRAMSAEKPS